MTDRELLELAAKAAGYPFRGYSGDNPLLEEDQSQPEPRLACPVVWNPLTDDGDALRLAVKLKIDIAFDEWNGKEIVTAASPEYFTGWLEEESLPDHYAATRRAVVRAAAEIGRAMK